MPFGPRAAILGAEAHLAHLARTGVVRDPLYLEHRNAGAHPESPRRLEAIHALLDSPAMAGRFAPIAARDATDEEILRVHTRAHLAAIADTASRDITFLDTDTQASRRSYAAARRAAGGACAAVEAVVRREVENAFALVRPPGHHAEPGAAMGFCLLNNAAIAARFARASLGIERVLIADWDVHHGNGTQAAFEEDPSVLYFSTHQWPLYPGSGALEEAGTGEGEGATINVPLPAGTGDADLLAVYREVLAPVALELRPGLLIVSAGFDILAADPLAGMRATEAGAAALARVVLDIAATACEGRLVLVLEGGYDLAALAAGVGAVLDEMDGRTLTRPSAGGESAAVRRLIERARGLHGRTWKSLAT